MATTSCETCGSWTVKDANFCFRCGQELSMSFEYTAAHNPPGLAKNRVFSSSNNSWKDKAATTILLTSATGIGAIVGAWEPSFIGIVPLGYLLWDPTSRLILDLLGKLPEKVETSAEQTTLKVEFKTPDSRHWLIQDFPPGIEIKHLQHVASKCLGEGEPFSRLALCEPGKLSQGEFRKIADFFLDKNYAFPRNEAAPNLGIQLTERATRLLKKAIVASG